VTYAPVLARALARPKTALAAAGALFAGSLALVPVVGFSLFPKAGLPQFRVTVEAPDGATLAETDRATRFAERALVGHPAVKAVMTNVGRGNPQIYYNVASRQQRANVGELFVLLREYDGRATEAFLDTLRARLAAYPAARIEVKEFENGPPIDAPVAIRLTGESLDTLRLLAGRVEGVLRRTPGTMYVDNPLRLRRTDLRVDVDESKAGLLGVTPLEVDRTVRLALAGVEAGRFREPDGDEHPIVVRLPAPAAGQTLDALGDVYVASGGGSLPLRQVADVRFAASPPSIQHHDRERAVTVTSFVRTGFNTDRVTKRVLAALDSLALPDGYALTAGGELESREESFGGLGGAIMVAVFGVLAILVLEFKTFKSTLIVASVIPLGVVGGLVALLIGGYSLSFTAVIGFVALVGVEIKNSILLVDFTNQLREQGVGLDEAIRRAGEVRFLPVVLTTMTAIGGLIPLAAQGSSLYSPLAAVIIGGLVSSTVLSRLVTPVAYKLLAPAVGEAAEEASATMAAPVPA
jgi:multidrug efflux pump subunit AcrB